MPSLKIKSTSPSSLPPHLLFKEHPTMSSHSASKGKRLLVVGSIAIAVIMMIASSARSMYNAPQPSALDLFDVPAKVIEINNREGLSADKLSDLLKISRELRKPNYHRR